MRITANADVDRVKPEDFPRYVSIFLSQVTTMTSNGLNFTENFDGKTLTITFSAANVDVAGIHGLGRAPNGYIVLGTTAAMSIYDGASANTAQLIYFRSSAVGTARILVV